MAGTIISDTIKSSLSTPTVFQNTSGTEVGQLCRAWVNFNGNTAARNASFNVGSITKNSTGDYTVNFTNALTDANYAITFGGRPTTQYLLGIQVKTGTTPTTTAVNITTGSYNTNFSDIDYLTVAVFR